MHPKPPLFTTTRPLRQASALTSTSSRHGDDAHVHTHNLNTHTQPHTTTHTQQQHKQSHTTTQTVLHTCHRVNIKIGSAVRDAHVQAHISAARTAATCVKFGCAPQELVALQDPHPPDHAITTTTYT